MKKFRDADELAARIAAAANQPPVILVSPDLVSQAPTHAIDISEIQPELGQRQKVTKLSDADTVPISLRPHRMLLNRYIMAAAERTREDGRVISAQQIMLEVLERAPI
jgi:hypothetical protein